MWVSALSLVLCLLTASVTTTPTTTMHNVFSFGSNSISQLRARVCNPHLQATPARARHWQRIFCVKSTDWTGAAASMTPLRDATCYGAMVSLSSLELSRLDQYEGGYHKQEMEVSIWTGGEWQPQAVIAYLANKPSWTRPPSEQYLTAIHLNLREQFRDIRPEVLDIDVYGVFGGVESEGGERDDGERVGESVGGCVHRVSCWSHPGTQCLSLQALCVEVNALRTKKWVMPRTINLLCKELDLYGISSSAQLAARLAVGFDLSLPSDQRDKIEFLDEEVLGLFKGLLRIDTGDTDPSEAIISDVTADDIPDKYCSLTF